MYASFLQEILHSTMKQKVVLKLKLNSNIYFRTSFWCLKKFYEGTVFLSVNVAGLPESIHQDRNKNTEQQTKNKINEMMLYLFNFKDRLLNSKDALIPER